MKKVKDRWYMPKRTETYVRRKTCTWILMSELFTIVKKRKQLKYPSGDTWTSKMWTLHTMEWRSSKRGMTCWLRLQRRRASKTLCWVKELVAADTHYVIPLVRNIQNRQMYTDKEQVDGGCGRNRQWVPVSAAILSLVFWIEMLFA